MLTVTRPIVLDVPEVQVYDITLTGPPWQVAVIYCLEVYSLEGGDYQSGLALELVVKRQENSMQPLLEYVGFKV